MRPMPRVTGLGPGGGIAAADRLHLLPGSVCWPETLGRGAERNPAAGWDMIGCVSAEGNQLVCPEYHLNS